LKTRLIIVRHAEAEGNINRIFHGWTDGNITENGHIQAKIVSKRLSKLEIDVIYSSTLKRTMQTAGYIAEEKNLPIIRTDKLWEINGGDWEGKNWDDLSKIWPQEYDTWENKPHLHKMPNGESMEAFQNRIISEIKYIIEHNKGKNICIVTHGTAIRALVCYLQGYELENMIKLPWYDNTSVTIVDYEKDKFKIITEGDASHLEKKYSTVQNQEWWNEAMKNFLGESSLKENHLLKAKAFLSNQSAGREATMVKMLTPYEKIISRLFETNAVRVCPENEPFWYTSGTIGPFYINTHFLYGSEEKANALLDVINKVKGTKLECPDIILKLTRENYKEDLIYKELIDEMLNNIKDKIEIDKVDFISGGERRDWFFSLLIAEKLKKQHITIYKDLSAVITIDGITSDIDDLKSGKVLHIADLITEASSYERAWIPAIKNINGKIIWSLVVIDRKQGGGELLENNNIKSISLVSVDLMFFDTALSLGYVNKTQFEMINAYMKNPKEAMKRFLIERPEFITNSLNADEKTKERAKLCIEKNFYGLK